MAERPRLAVERDDAVVRVWFDRPARHNPLDTRTLEELVDLFGRLASDCGVRVVVLGGRGPSFTAGADLAEPPRADGAPGRRRHGPPAPVVVAARPASRRRRGGQRGRPVAVGADVVEADAAGLVGADPGGQVGHQRLGGCALRRSRVPAG
jgi:Enoyl-CoA hydratase/isomerase